MRKRERDFGGGRVRVRNREGVSRERGRGAWVREGGQGTAPGALDDANGRGREHRGLAARLVRRRRRLCRDGIEPGDEGIVGRERLQGNRGQRAEDTRAHPANPGRQVNPEEIRERYLKLYTGAIADF